MLSFPPAESLFWQKKSRREFINNLQQRLLANKEERVVQCDCTAECIHISNRPGEEKKLLHCLVWNMKTTRQTFSVCVYIYLWHLASAKVGFYLLLGSTPGQFDNICSKPMVGPVMHSDVWVALIHDLHPIGGDIVLHNSFWRFAIPALHFYPVYDVRKQKKACCVWTAALLCDPLLAVANIRLRCKNLPTSDSNLAHWSVLENVKKGHKSWIFNCIFTTFAAFTTDKDLPHGQSYYTKANKVHK